MCLNNEHSNKNKSRTKKVGGIFKWARGIRELGGGLLLLQNPYQRRIPVLTNSYTQTSHKKPNKSKDNLKAQGTEIVILYF